jgi:hypothetical protein
MPFNPSSFILTLTQGLPRTVAQLIMHSLIPMILRNERLDFLISSPNLGAKSARNSSPNPGSNSGLNPDPSLDPNSDHSSKDGSEDNPDHNPDPNSSPIGVEWVFENTLGLESQMGYLEGIYRYLEHNKEASKIMAKQRKFFKDYDPYIMCRYGLELRCLSNV